MALQSQKTSFMSIGHRPVLKWIIAMHDYIPDFVVLLVPAYLDSDSFAFGAHQVTLAVDQVCRVFEHNFHLMAALLQNHNCVGSSRSSNVSTVCSCIRLRLPCLPHDESFVNGDSHWCRCRSPCSEHKADNVGSIEIAKMSSCTGTVVTGPVIWERRERRLARAFEEVNFTCWEC